MAVASSHQMRASLARISSRASALRPYSSPPWNSSDWTLADEASDQEADASPLGRAINQVYSEYRFQRLAPSWLPLRPEASFFIPPSPPLTKIIEKHASAPAAPSLSVADIRFLLNPFGYTCSEAVGDVHALPKALPTSPELRKAIRKLKVAAGIPVRQVN